MTQFRGVHDMGGLPAGPVEPSEHDYALWEKRVDALLVLLSKKGHITVDELRRNIESLGSDAYDRMGYYERWIYAITQTLIQRGLITIGLAVGALVPALRVTVGNPDAPGWFRLGGLAVVVLLYLAAIAIAVAGMRRASAAPRGFTLRYHLGLGGTMALYAGYVVLQSARGEDALAWHWTITAALVTTIPALLGARAISKLALR